MRIGIHQINFFPWLGYFNKMAKSDLFIYLDRVQLADRGPSQRTFMLENGEKVTVPVGIKMKGHREKEFREIELNENSPWKDIFLRFVEKNYSTSEYYDEILGEIQKILDSHFTKLMDINMESIEMTRMLLGISTPIIMQSDIDYDENARKGDLMMQLTKAVGGDIYLSGTGARAYMDLSVFRNNGIEVQYQTFLPFEYFQGNNSFVPGLSALDAFFHIGHKETKRLFWENIQNNEIIE